MTDDIEFSSELSVKLIDHMGTDASVLAAMMVSTQGPESLDMLDVDPDQARGKLEFLMENRHGSPWEHSAMTFFIEAPIAVFREWHRHRIGWGYNETSGRYKKLEPKFYIPPPERPLVQVGKAGEYTYVPGTDAQYAEMVADFKESHTAAYATYQRQLDRGIAKEVARGCLPVYLYSSMYATCNPRSLMAFLSLRSKDDGATFPSFPMWEIEMCADRAEEHFAGLFPNTHSLFRKHGSVSP